MRHSILSFSLCLLALQCSLPPETPNRDFPEVLSIRDRTATVNRITKERLEELLPKVMREAEFDMWLLISNEDNYDPVFETMVPYDAWCPITQILVFYDPGPGKDIERLNVSRTNMKGLHENAWDARAWDESKQESQWDCLVRIIRERDPKRMKHERRSNSSSIGVKHG